MHSRHSLAAVAPHTPRTLAPIVPETIDAVAQPPTRVHAITVAALAPLVFVVGCTHTQVVGGFGCSLILLLAAFCAGVAVCAHRFDKVYRDAQKVVIEQHSNDLRGLTDESTEMAREAARAIEAARAALRDLRCQFIEIQKGR